MITSPIHDDNFYMRKIAGHSLLEHIFSRNDLYMELALYHVVLVADKDAFA